MLGRKAEEVLNRAGANALRQMHEFVTVEHVLHALLEESQVWDLIVAVGGDFEAIKKGAEKYLNKEVPKARKLTDQNKEDEDLIEPPAATLGLQRLVQRAIFQVQSSGRDEVRPEDLFVAIFQAKDSIALHLLESAGLTKLSVIEYLSHGPTTSGPPAAADRANSDEDSRQEEKKSPSSDPLGQFTTALHELAHAGKLDPLVGRTNEIARMIQTLCRRRKNNVVLVGEAGVGKTALAEGLALKVVAGEVPEPLKDAEIYALDMGALLAGARFRGDFEQRLKKVIKALQKKRDKGTTVILFIDEIHTIIGAGSVSGGSLDAANLLKPALSRGELLCIGSTTYDEYRTVFEKDHALSRRFQKVDIAEPSKDEALQILRGLKAKFEEHHKVEYAEEALKAAVDLSVQHLNDRFLPDKAIDLIDEVGAKTRLAGKTFVSAREIEEIVAQIARIPERSVSHDQKAKLKNLGRDLKRVIFGQEHAIDQVANAILLSRSGLRSGEKPVGSFLFCGPTGVGKTELAKQLAHTLGIPFLRFDMSEYMEKHTVSRLIGAPPGYVGFEQAGMLTDAVRKNPHAVVLLDEIEKAHPDVWNILLQVMDHGTLTDNNGKKADFRNVAIIMTSNVGSREHEKNPLGMQLAHNTGEASKKEVERAFSPEFRNRLDAIVFFNPLDPVTVAQVVGKQLTELETQLNAKGVDIDVDADAREWLARKGYDKQMGARPMARLIQEKIKKPLAEEILFGRLDDGGKVIVKVKNDEFDFVIEPKKLALPLKEDS